jgi:hypothetical protein
MDNLEYSQIIVESFIPDKTSGKHGNIHIRPVRDQNPFLENMFVECSKKLSNDYPVGTRFKISAKITSKDGGTPFIYSHYSWKFEVIAK